MQRYGIVRPISALIIDFLRGSAKQARALWRQRHLEVGRRVQIASNVTCFGDGRIILHDGVVVRNSVILRSWAGATLEIGAGSTLDNGSFLDAAAGQILTVGANFRLGERAAICSVAGVFWGEDGGLGANSQVGPREAGVKGRLTIGCGSDFQQHTLFDLCSDINIGDHVRAGPFCALYTHNHVPAAGKLIWEQGIKVNPIQLGHGIWIGRNCTILPGVEIGSNSVIAASAVVTRHVDPGSIIGGVPAKVISRLDEIREK